MEKTTVGLVSLGCAKNLIDSEVMIGHLAEAGMMLTPDPELADVLIVGFPGDWRGYDLVAAR
jgi:ribosomal protein S12 methylthiotransferase